MRIVAKVGWKNKKVRGDNLVNSQVTIAVNVQLAITSYNKKRRHFVAF